MHIMTNIVSMLYFVDVTIKTLAILGQFYEECTETRESLSFSALGQQQLEMLMQLANST